MPVMYTQIKRDKRRPYAPKNQSARFHYGNFSCLISPESWFQDLLSSADNVCKSAGFVNCSDSENVVAVHQERDTGDTRVKVEICQDFTWDVYQSVKLHPRSFMLHRVQKVVPALKDFPDTIEKKHFPQLFMCMAHRSSVQGIIHSHHL